MKRTIALCIAAIFTLCAVSLAAQEKKTRKVKKTVPITAKLKVKNKKKLTRMTKRGSALITLHEPSGGSPCDREGKTDSTVNEVEGTCTVQGKKYSCTCQVRVEFVCEDGKNKYTGSTPLSCEIKQPVETDSIVAPETQTW